MDLAVDLAGPRREMVGLEPRPALSMRLVSWLEVHQLARLSMVDFRTLRWLLLRNAG